LQPSAKSILNIFISRYGRRSDLRRLERPLPRCYQTSAEVPQHISTLLDRIGQKPALEQQQPQRDPNEME
jgi:hypothetical protein